jgi:hypothetical protein
LLWALSGSFLRDYSRENHIARTTLGDWVRAGRGLTEPERDLVRVVHEGKQKLTEAERAELKGYADAAVAEAVGLGVNLKGGMPTSLATAAAARKRLDTNGSVALRRAFVLAWAVSRMSQTRFAAGITGLSQARLSSWVSYLPSLGMSDREQTLVSKAVEAAQQHKVYPFGGDELAELRLAVREAAIQAKEQGQDPGPEIWKQAAPAGFETQPSTGASTGRFEAVTPAEPSLPTTSTALPHPSAQPYGDGTGAAPGLAFMWPAALPDDGTPAFPWSSTAQDVLPDAPLPAPQDSLGTFWGIPEEDEVWDILHGLEAHQPPVPPIVPDIGFATGSFGPTYTGEGESATWLAADPFSIASVAAFSSSLPYGEAQRTDSPVFPGPTTPAASDLTAAYFQPGTGPRR